MKKLFILVTGFVMAAEVCYADVFSHPARVEDMTVPQFNSVSCKFTQEKTIPNSVQNIKSGGDFRFIKDKGVVFDTTYPVKMTTSYTSDDNRRISGIISAINKKDYSYLNKNFSIFYEKKGSMWTIALKPKQESKINAHIASILIDGNTYIDKISINTKNSGSTKINFTNCR